MKKKMASKGMKKKMASKGMPKKRKTPREKHRGR